MLIRSFYKLQSVDPGFDPDGLLTLTMIPRHEIEDRSQIPLFLGEVIDRLGALPGVSSVGEINFVPYSDRNAQENLTIDGRPPLREGAEQRINFRAISPDYFDTMEIPLEEGRGFDSRDVAEPAVAIVNRAAVEKYWPGEDPIGARVRYYDDQEWLRVVGVVADIRHYSLEEDAAPELFVPYSADPFSTRTFLLRTEGDPRVVADAARRTIRDVNDRLPVFDVKTMNQMIDEVVGW